MPARPRHFRRVLQWGGLLGCVLILLTLVGSRYFSIDYYRHDGPRDTLIDLSSGCIYVLSCETITHFGERSGIAHDDSDQIDKVGH